MSHLIPQFLPKEPNHPRHSMNIEKYVSVVERFFRNGYAFLISREGAGEDATEQKQHGNKIKKKLFVSHRTIPENTTQPLNVAEPGRVTSRT